MGHRFHSGVSSPTVEILDPVMASDLIDPSASATLVANGFGNTTRRPATDAACVLAAIVLVAVQCSCLSRGPVASFHCAGFTEGPVWVAEHGYWIFSDIDGDRLHRYTPATREVVVQRENSEHANGNCIRKTETGEGKSSQTGRQLHTLTRQLLCGARRSRAPDMWPLRQSRRQCGEPGARWHRGAPIHCNPLRLTFV